MLFIILMLLFIVYRSEELTTSPLGAKNWFCYALKPCLALVAYAAL